MYKRLYQMGIYLLYLPNEAQIAAILIDLLPCLERMAILSVYAAGLYADSLQVLHEALSDRSG